MKKAFLALVLSASLAFSGCSTKWVTVAEADLPILINIASSIVQLADPNLDKDIQEYGAEAQADFALLDSLIKAYNAAPAASKATTSARILQVLNEVSGHLAAIEAAAHVKNTTKAQHIAQAVQVAILTITSIIALMQNSKTVTAAQLPNPAQLQAVLDDLKAVAHG